MHMIAQTIRGSGNRRRARRARLARLPRVAVAALAALGALAPLACGDDVPTRPPETAELELARGATARYQDVDRALADGYADAGIVMQAMGHHYLNAKLLDDRFEPDRPEILVYAPEGGRMKLVAVEYAVPLDRAATAPAGFAGGGDVWSRNTKYGLWTLHAWLWLDNAAGVFAAENARVRLDPRTLQGMAAPGGH
jgi:hypothetical protein